MQILPKNIQIKIWNRWTHQSKTFAAKKNLSVMHVQICTQLKAICNNIYKMHTTLCLKDQKTKINQMLRYLIK